MGEIFYPPAPSDVPLPCFDDARKIVRKLGDIDPNTVKAIIQAVTDKCKSLDIGRKCVAFGSVGSGLSTNTSDIDLVIDAGCDEPSERQDKKDIASNALSKLRPMLQEDGFLVVEQVAMSRVPVLKLLSPENIEVDISYNNMGAEKNTLLIKQYVSLDPAHIGGLIKLVKQWAKAKGVCGAYRGHLSSYAWTLSSVFFLQIEYGLPNLQNEPSCHEWKENRLHLIGLEKLFRNFFNFYADKFEWGKDVCSIRIGHRVNWDDPEMHDTHRQWNNKEVLDIEDPFDRTGNIHTKRRNLSVVFSKSEEIAKVREHITIARETVSLQQLFTVDETAEQKCEWCKTTETIGGGGGKFCKRCWRKYYEDKEEKEKKMTRMANHMNSNRMNGNRRMGDYENRMTQERAMANHQDNLRTAMSNNPDRSMVNHMREERNDINSKRPPHEPSANENQREHHHPRAFAEMERDFRYPPTKNPWAGVPPMPRTSEDSKVYPPMEIRDQFRVDNNRDQPHPSINHRDQLHPYFSIVPPKGEAVASFQ